MAVAQKMLHFMESGSWIRKMFEEGGRLRKIYGDDKVYDFSLGNPNVPPPEVVKKKLLELVEQDDPPCTRICPMPGCLKPWRPCRPTCVVSIACLSPANTWWRPAGRRAGLNIILKALLDPGGRSPGARPSFR